MSTKALTNKNNLFLNILKGTLVAVSITLVLILIFALIIRFFNISDGWIFPVNQIIKVLSLFFGIIVSIKMQKEKGFLQGILIGITYFLLSFIIFSILQARFSFGLNNLYDFILTTLMSGLIGVIVINIKK